jgi:hypothetical protein
MKWLHLFFLLFLFTGKHPLIWGEMCELRDLKMMEIPQLPGDEWETFFRRAGADIREFAGEEGSCEMAVDGIPVEFNAKDGVLALIRDNQIWPLPEGPNFAAMLDPIIPAMDICYFDLLCPFFSWEDVVYEGGERLLGRGAHRFFVSDGQGHGVRIWLHSKQGYPLGWDLYGADQQLLRRFRLRTIARDKNGEWRASRMKILVPAIKKEVRIEIFESFFPTL